MQGLNELLRENLVMRVRVDAPAGHLYLFKTVLEDLDLSFIIEAALVERQLAPGNRVDVCLR